MPDADRVQGQTMRRRQRIEPEKIFIVILIYSKKEKGDNTYETEKNVENLYK